MGLSSAQLRVISKLVRFAKYVQYCRRGKVVIRSLILNFSQPSSYHYSIKLYNWGENVIDDMEGTLLK